MSHTNTTPSPTNQNTQHLMMINWWLLWWKTKKKTHKHTIRFWFTSNQRLKIYLPLSSSFHPLSRCKITPTFYNRTPCNLHLHFQHAVNSPILFLHRRFKRWRDSSKPVVPIGLPFEKWLVVAFGSVSFEGREGWVGEGFEEIEECDGG